MKEEGDECVNKKCTGYYEFREVEECSCHINPPCGACAENPLVCSICLENEDGE